MSEESHLCSDVSLRYKKIPALNANSRKKEKTKSRMRIASRLSLYSYYKINTVWARVQNFKIEKTAVANCCKETTKKIFLRFHWRDSNPRTPKKVSSKPKRGERVYKRTAKAQSDLFRKRRSNGAFMKKIQPPKRLDFLIGA